MSTWQSILNSVYNDNFDHVESILRKNKIPLDHPREAAEVIASVVGAQLARDDHTGVSETIAYYLKSPYVCRSTFAEWVAYDIMKHPKYREMYFGTVQPHCAAARIQALEFKLKNIYMPPRQIANPTWLSIYRIRTGRT